MLPRHLKKQIIMLYQQGVSFDAIVTQIRNLRPSTESAQIAKVIQDYRWGHYRKTRTRL